MRREPRDVIRQGSRHRYVCDAREHLAKPGDCADGGLRVVSGRASTRFADARRVAVSA